MELFKNIATVVGCISGIIALSMTIFKPIRKWIVDAITHKNKENESDKKLNQVVESIGKIETAITTLDQRIDKIEKNVLENETDRLKSELARYAAICRRGEPLYESDYLHIQEVYEKYNVKLHGNHTGTDNYNTIKKYFEEQ